jgi:hypothetical protein
MTQNSLYKPLFHHLRDYEPYHFCSVQIPILASTKNHYNKCNESYQQVRFHCKLNYLKFTSHLKIERKVLENSSLLFDLFLFQIILPSTTDQPRKKFVLNSNSIFPLTFAPSFSTWFSWFRSVVICSKYNFGFSC